MKPKTSKKIMTCIGATLAVCSALSMMGSANVCSSSSTKKTIKKTINKMSDVVDAISAMM